MSDDKCTYCKFHDTSRYYYGKCNNPKYMKFYRDMQGFLETKSYDSYDIREFCDDWQPSFIFKLFNIFRLMKSRKNLKILNKLKEENPENFL